MHKDLYKKNIVFHPSYGWNTILLSESFTIKDSDNKIKKDMSPQACDYMSINGYLYDLNLIRNYIDLARKQISYIAPGSVSKLLSNLPIVFTTEVETLATDDCNIFANPSFVYQLLLFDKMDMDIESTPNIEDYFQVDGMIFVLLHELYHVIYQHSDRSKVFRTTHPDVPYDSFIENMAMDYEINYIIEHTFPVDPNRKDIMKKILRAMGNTDEDELNDMIHDDSLYYETDEEGNVIKGDSGKPIIRQHFKGCTNTIGGLVSEEPQFMRLWEDIYIDLIKYKDELERKAEKIKPSDDTIEIEWDKDFEDGFKKGMEDAIIALRKEGLLESCRGTKYIMPLLLNESTETLKKTGYDAGYKEGYERIIEILKASLNTGSGSGSGSGSGMELPNVKEKTKIDMPTITPTFELPKHGRTDSIPPDINAPRINAKKTSTPPSPSSGSHSGPSSSSSSGSPSSPSSSSPSDPSSGSPSSPSSSSPSDPSSGSPSSPSSSSPSSPGGDSEINKILDDVHSKMKVPGKSDSSSSSGSAKGDDDTHIAVATDGYDGKHAKASDGDHILSKEEGDRIRAAAGYKPTKNSEISDMVHSKEASKVSGVDLSKCREDLNKRIKTELSHSSSPGHGICDMIEDKILHMYDSVVDWKEALEDFLRGFEAETTYDRYYEPSRLENSVLYRPKNIPVETADHILIAIDTSGSVFYSAELFDHFLSEITQIIKDTKVYQLHIYLFSDGVHSKLTLEQEDMEDVIHGDENFNIKPGHTGGTSLTDVFANIEEDFGEYSDNKLKAFILLTDDDFFRLTSEIPNKFDFEYADSTIFLLAVSNAYTEHYSTAQLAKVVPFGNPIILTQSDFNNQLNSTM